jgi:hypothetical protein
MVLPGEHMTRGADLLETDSGLLAGYGCNERGPFLIIDRLDEVPWERVSFSPSERDFTLESLEGRFCVGRCDLASGVSSPCPIRAELRADAPEQCSACFVVTGFNPAFYNAPQISEPQRRRNRLPHVVYLASFGAGALKVGMTLEARGVSRLLEQGARLGAIIAKCEDAERARELEEYVARQHGIAESVRTSRKRQLLGAPLAEAAARAELEARIATIARERPDVNADAEIESFDAFYGGARLLGAGATDLSDTEPLAISGHCLGMIGDVLVALQDGQRYQLSVGPMVGRRVRLGSSLRRNHFVGQLGLPF